MTFSTKRMIDRFAGPSFHMARGRRVAKRERGGPVKAGPFLAKASNGLRAHEDQRPLGRPPPLAGSPRGFRSFAAGLSCSAEPRRIRRFTFEARYQIALSLYAFLLRSKQLA